MILSLAIIGFVLSAASGAFDAVRDKIMFHFDESIFDDHEKYDPLFWNPEYSHKNKWKNGNKMYGEKFWGSSSIFVWYTDAWHRFKMFMHVSIFSGVTLAAYSSDTWYLALSGAICCYALNRALFNLFFDKILVKK